MKSNETPVYVEELVDHGIGDLRMVHADRGLLCSAGINRYALHLGSFACTNSSPFSSLMDFTDGQIHQIGRLEIVIAFQLLGPGRFPRLLRPRSRRRHSFHAFSESIGLSRGACKLRLCRRRLLRRVLLWRTRSALGRPPLIHVRQIKFCSSYVPFLWLAIDTDVPTFYACLARVFPITLESIRRA